MYARTLSLKPVVRASGLAESMALALARRLLRGRLTLRLHDGRSMIYAGGDAGPQAAMRINDPRVFRRLLSGGELGLAEAYLDGDWETLSIPPGWTGL